MANYIYDGVLTAEVLKFAGEMLQEQPFPVEVKGVPNHCKFEEVFSKMSYEVFSEDCMGQSYTEKRQGVDYGLLHKDFLGDEEGCFLFFPSKLARDKFVEAFEGIVVDKNPFKTIIN